MSISSGSPRSCARLAAVALALTLGGCGWFFDTGSTDGATWVQVELTLRVQVLDAMGQPVPARTTVYVQWGLWDPLVEDYTTDSLFSQSGTTGAGIATFRGTFHLDSGQHVDANASLTSHTPLENPDAGRVPRSISYEVARASAQSGYATVEWVIALQK